jgi:hypothetical protein
MRFGRPPTYSRKISPKLLQSRQKPIRLGKVIPPTENLLCSFRVCDVYFAAGRGSENEDLSILLVDGELLAESPTSLCDSDEGKVEDCLWQEVAIDDVLEQSMRGAPSAYWTDDDWEI